MRKNIFCYIYHNNNATPSQKKSFFPFFLSPFSTHLEMKRKSFVKTRSGVSESRRKNEIISLAAAEENSITEIETRNWGRLPWANLRSGAASRYIYIRGCEQLNMYCTSGTFLAIRLNTTGGGKEWEVSGNGTSEKLSNEEIPCQGGSKKEGNEYEIFFFPLLWLHLQQILPDQPAHPSRRL